MITGTFLCAHAGHIELFEFGSKYGKVTVGLNGDDYLKQKYGEDIIPLTQRAYVVGSCKFVNNVVFFNEENPIELIRKLRPRYFIRGPDYLNQKLIEQDILDEVGSKLIIHQTEKINSSSIILQRLKRLA